MVTLAKTTNQNTANTLSDIIENKFKPYFDDTTEAYTAVQTKLTEWTDAINTTRDTDVAGQTAISEGLKELKEEVDYAILDKIVEMIISKELEQLTDYVKQEVMYAARAALDIFNSRIETDIKNLDIGAQKQTDRVLENFADRVDAALQNEMLAATITDNIIKLGKLTPEEYAKPLEKLIKLNARIETDGTHLADFDKQEAIKKELRELSKAVKATLAEKEAASGGAAPVPAPAPVETPQATPLKELSAEDMKKLNESVERIKKLAGRLPYITIGSRTQRTKREGTGTP